MRIFCNDESQIKKKKNAYRGHKVSGATMNRLSLDLLQGHHKNSKSLTSVRISSWSQSLNWASAYSVRNLRKKAYFLLGFTVWHWRFTVFEFYTNFICNTFTQHHILMSLVFEKFNIILLVLVLLSSYWFFLVIPKWWFFENLGNS